MLSTVATITSPRGREFYLTSCGQLFTETKGSVKFLKPSRGEWIEDWEPEEIAEAELLDWREDRMPNRQQTAFIYKMLFSQYKHETCCWYGIIKDGKDKGKLAFYVPKQHCSAAHVTIEDGEENAVFARTCRILGDMHSHPWAGQPRMSGTDEQDMRGSPGIHAIFSSTGLVSWYGSVRGCVAHLFDENITDVEPEKTELLTNGGISIEECVKPPAQHRHTSYTNGDYRVRDHRSACDTHWSNRHQRSTEDEDWSDWIGASETIYLPAVRADDEEKALRDDVELAIDRTWPNFFEPADKCVLVMLPNGKGGFVPRVLGVEDWEAASRAIKRETGITLIRGVNLGEVDFGDALGYMK